MFKPALAGAAVALASCPAFAADTAAGSLDLTSIINTVVACAIPVIGGVAVALIDSHVKNVAAARVLDNAVNNSLGALQQAAQSQVTTISPHVTLPGVAANVAPALQYVLDHAGDEAKRLGITSDAIVDKIRAKLGLANIATNLAVSASPAPLIVPPTAPVPPPPKD